MCVYFGGSLCILKAFTQLMSLNLVRIKTTVTIDFITLYALGENVCYGCHQWESQGRRQDMQ